MKICSYNVNSIRARKNLLFQWLERRDFDIEVFGLQELKVPEEEFPFEEWNNQGYGSAVFGQPQYHGVAISSRLPMEKIKKGFGDPEWDKQKRIISCRLGELAIINVYVPHGEERGGKKYHYKLDWYRQFLQYLETNHSPQDPLLVVGDFNVAREDQDVYDAEAMRDTVATMPEEREAFERLLEWGLVDTFRYLYPTEEGFTWWSYMGGAIWKNEGLRIDYILATSPLLDYLEKVEVDRWPRRKNKITPSDHAPVIAEFSHL